ncbi:hypothetical protein SDC9_122888 [bioreactor metagenome]|uniref:Uncharacterized protein n=1 Tax=bioreactor metagenome TaxID=1076179 RepID=A0A645CG17_9ZZZZ
MVEGATGRPEGDHGEHLGGVRHHRVAVERFVDVRRRAADEGAPGGHEGIGEVQLVGAGGPHPGDVPVRDDPDVLRVEHRGARPALGLRPALQADAEQIRTGRAAGELPHPGAPIAAVDLLDLLHRELAGGEDDVGAVGVDLGLRLQRQCAEVDQRRAEAGHPAGGRVDGRDLLDPVEELRRRQRLPAEHRRRRGAVDAGLLQQVDVVAGDIALLVELVAALPEDLEGLLEGTFASRSRRCGQVPVVAHPGLRFRVCFRGAANVRRTPRQAPSVLPRRSLKVFPIAR